MANADGDVVQADLADSNMANYDSPEAKAARKGAAASEKAFKGAGKKPGLEVWRVENKRTANDTPLFGIARWTEEVGSFYTGDSYLVLNTYFVKDPETGKQSDKLGWDVHFWLGSESSQDEIGVAAYKAVELDDLLDDGPVQHREVQLHESKLFQSYFTSIQYLEGGIASGFRKVKPTEYKPRLLQVRRTRKTVRVVQVPVAASSMNHGDVFILDAGLAIYLWVGDEANPFEKSKGANVTANIIGSRLGKAKKADPDEKFWEILGGSIDDVKPSEERVADPEDGSIDPEKCKLWRISDAGGSISFNQEAEGELSTEMLDSNDAFLVDANLEMFVWIGNGASHGEKSQSMKIADQYLNDNGYPMTVPITRIMEGQINAGFSSCFKM